MIAAPANQKTQATVVKWKPDFTYDTLRKGTNRLVCYDRSGFPQQQPFSVQCTSLANLDRVKQNLQAEAKGDRKVSEAWLAEQEKAGTRVKPEFGSMWHSVAGPDQSTGPSAPLDDRRAGRHHAVDRPARQSETGRRLDHERGDVDGARDASELACVRRRAAGISGFSPGGRGKVLARANGRG